MSSGKVVLVSRNGAMLVVQHDDGFTLVELMGDEGEVGIGSTVKGDWDAQGSEPLMFDGRRLDAFFQGTWATAELPVAMAKEAGA